MARSRSPKLSRLATGSPPRTLGAPCRHAWAAAQASGSAGGRCGEFGGATTGSRTVGPWALDSPPAPWACGERMAPTSCASPRESGLGEPGGEPRPTTAERGGEESGEPADRRRSDEEEAEEAAGGDQPMWQTLAWASRPRLAPQPAARAGEPSSALPCRPLPSAPAQWVRSLMGTYKNFQKDGY